ncbi:MAG TPA: hypothetical protein VNQ79_22990 [Blastocatellia bacterium]|nr:hypothetical protein [Blastocatellia bacterium]
MAVTNPFDRLRRKRRQAVTGGTTRLTRRLSPPDHRQNEQAQNTDGIIRPRTGRLHLSSDLIESGGGMSDEGANKVVIVVVALALIFIGLIAWFIAHE